MSDYKSWESVLAGTPLPVHEDSPQPGFWRKRTGKAKGYIPVALWEMDGKIVGVANLEVIDPREVWTYCCTHATTEQQYWDRVNTGKWFDEDDSVTASLTPPPVGHNQPDAVDSIKDQITSALAGVDAYTEVKDDATAAKAQSLRSRLLELSREADKTRETLKRPHFEAGKAVDELYQPLVKSAKGGADAIAKALGTHETRKANEAAAAAHVLAEARRKALEAEQARAPIGVTVEPEPVPAPSVAPAPAPIKGAYGRGANVKDVKIATVADQDAAYAFLKAQPELIEVIQKLAQKMVTNGLSVPGVTVTVEKRVV